MSDSEHATGAGAAGGDPVQELLLGFASTIDQLAGLIGGSSTTSTAAVGAAGPVPDLLGELGTLLTELGDLVARILTAFIAVLEAVADMLRSSPAQASTTPTGYQPIAVQITTPGRQG